MAGRIAEGLNHLRELSDIALGFLNRIADKWLLSAMFWVLIGSGGEFAEKAALVVLGVLVNVMTTRRSQGQEYDGRWSRSGRDQDRGKRQD